MKVQGSNAIAFIIGVVLILAIFAAGHLAGSRAGRQAGRQATEALKDTQSELRQTKDKLGRTISTVNVLELDKRQLEHLATSKDSTLRKLQAAIKAQPKVKAATVFAATTRGKTSASTTKIGYVATDSTRLKPEYSGSVRRPDIEAEIRANSDSVYLDSYTVYTEFELIEHQESRGFLKRPEYVLSIKPLNPNTVVTDARTWRKPAPRRHTALKIGLAAAISFVIGAAVF